MKGWIKLHRSLIDWEWYSDRNAVLLLVHLLIRVNHEDKKWRGILIKAGSMVLSWQTLAEGSKMSVQQCRTAMQKLENSGEVTRKSTNRYQVISLVKWEKMQSDNRQVTRKSTNKQQTDNKQITTTKEVKEYKENKEVIRDFKKSIQPHLKIYGKDLLNEFYLYWTEKKPRGKNMRFEMERTFDVGRRLKRWSDNDFGINKKVKSQEEKMKVTKTALTDKEQDVQKDKYDMNLMEEAFDKYVKGVELSEVDNWMCPYLRFKGVRIPNKLDGIRGVKNWFDDLIKNKQQPKDEL